MQRSVWSLGSGFGLPAIFLVTFIGVRSSRTYSGTSHGLWYLLCVASLCRAICAPCMMVAVWGAAHELEIDTSQCNFRQSLGEDPAEQVLAKRISTQFEGCISLRLLVLQKSAAHNRWWPRAVARCQQHIGAVSNGSTKSTRR